MNYYKKRQQQLRETAIKWQTNFDPSTDYETLFIAIQFFAEYSKRYGLITEFKENGIL